jgi:hypothetical protein
MIVTILLLGEEVEIIFDPGALSATLATTQKSKIADSERRLEGAIDCHMFFSGKSVDL